MARRVTPLYALGAVIVVLGATVIAVAAITDSSDASSGATAAVSAQPLTDAVAPMHGTVGGAPVTIRVLAPRGTVPQAGSAVTLAVRTSAPLTGIRVAGPSGAPLPAMTGALFISRSTGDIDAPAATTHGHAHSQGQRIGAALGATGVFAARMSPGATTVAVDSQGTRLAATYPDVGTIETVDLVRGTRPVRSQAVTRPTAVWFAPSGQDLWVNDADAGVRVVPVRGAASSVIGGAPGRNVVAFAPSRGLAAIAGDGTTEAAIVRLADHTRTATLDLPAPATSVAFIASPPSLVVTHGDGSLSVAPLDRTAGRPFRIPTGIAGGAGTTAVVTPDGTRAALLLPASRRLAVIDLMRHRLLTTVGTGPDPAGLVLLQQRFAVTRSTTGPAATWVDVRTPQRAADLPLGDRPATSMALTDDGTRLLFTDPAARQVLDVHAMMGRPMVMGVIPGTFAPDDIAAFPGGMRRSGPHEYRRVVVLAEDGAQRITVSSPQGSFTGVLPAVGRPSSARTASVIAYPRQMARGSTGPVTLAVGGQPAASVEVLLVSHDRTGVHQVRARAVQRNGRWVASVRPPAAGLYAIFAVVIP